MLILKWLSKYLGLKVRYMNLLVFLLLNKGLSAFPVTGMDNLFDLRLILQVKYPPAGVITDG
jgi:hypothetical protein